MKAVIKSVKKPHKGFCLQPRGSQEVVPTPARPFFRGRKSQSTFTQRKGCGGGGGAYTTRHKQTAAAALIFLILSQSEGANPFDR